MIMSEKLTIKEINQRYVNRVIGSLENDKELWVREVICGMDGCFVDYYSPKYPTKDGGTLSFSDMGLVSAHINGVLAWEISFWMYYNPFSSKSKQLRKAMNRMKVYHIEKEAQGYRDKLTNSIK